MMRGLRTYLFFTFILVILTLRSGTALQRTLPTQNSTSPCIFLDVNFTITFTAYNGTAEVAKQRRTQNDIVSVSSSCAPAVHTLVFTNGTVWSFLFNEDSNGDIHLERTVQFVPRKLFGGSVNDTEVVSVTDKTTTDLFKPPLSYLCDKLDVTQYTNNAISSKALLYQVIATVFRIQIRAFSTHNIANDSTPILCNLHNSTHIRPYSNKKIEPTPLSLEMESDSTPTTSNNSTTESPTTSDTTTITTTPRPEAPVNNYIVKGDNYDCISLQGAFSITIDYNASTSAEARTGTASVNIPANSTGTGNCNETSNSQTLVISFFDDWSLEVVFTLDGSDISSAAHGSSDLKYGITNLTLIYVTNNTIFPDSALPQGTTVKVFPHSTKDIDYPRKSTSKEYYKCNSVLNLKIDDGVTVHATQLLFKAFNNNNDTTFSGRADECATDVATSQTVPIAVACALGGLVFVVVVAYSIDKFRKSS